MNVVLYTTGCPQCKALKQKLDNNHINYEIVDDPQKMTDLGFTAAPMLEVDNKVMGFIEAIRWADGTKE